MKTKIILTVIVLMITALIAFYAVVPGLVKERVNRSIDNLPGYTGGIDKVSINLFKAAFEISGIDIRKVNADDPNSFMKMEKAHFNLEWGALINGRIVSEIDFHNPQINYTKGATQEADQTGKGVGWATFLKELSPISINRLTAHNASVHYRNSHTNPAIDIAFTNGKIVLENIQNIKSNDEAMPGRIDLKGVLFDSGDLSVEGQFDLIQQEPEIDLALSLEGVQMTALNDLLRVYASLDAEGGILNAYSELEVKNSEINGYIKPLITDLSLVTFDEFTDDPIDAVWDGVSGLAAELLENQEQEEIGARVPLYGTVSDMKLDILFTAILSALSNGFIDAIEEGTGADLD